MTITFGSRQINCLFLPLVLGLSFPFLFLSPPPQQLLAKKSDAGKGNARRRVCMLCVGAQGGIIWTNE